MGNYGVLRVYQSCWYSINQIHFNIFTSTGSITATSVNIPSPWRNLGSLVCSSSLMPLIVSSMAMMSAPLIKRKMACVEQCDPLRR